jgi:hypothetical protein
MRNSHVHPTSQTVVTHRRGDKIIRPCGVVLAVR